MSKSGWIVGDNFLDWFGSAFVSAVYHLLQSRPVVLFVDGHHSHLALSLIKLAKEKGVHLFCIPPHTTHIATWVSMALLSSPGRGY